MSALVCLGDFFGDGDDRLAVAGVDRSLRCWRGGTLASTTTLPGTPSALATFVAPDPKTGAHLCHLAAAVGSRVLVFRKMKPWCAVPIPPAGVEQGEADAWERLDAADRSGGATNSSNAIDAADAALAALEADGRPLTPKTIEYLALAPGESRAEFRAALSGESPAHPPSAVSAACTVDATSTTPGALSRLLVATEDGRVCLLDESGEAVERSAWVWAEGVANAVDGAAGPRRAAGPSAGAAAFVGATGSLSGAAGGGEGLGDDGQPPPDSRSFRRIDSRAAGAARGAPASAAAPRPGELAVVHVSRDAEARVLLGPRLEQRGRTIPLPAPAVWLAVHKDSFVVACMDGSVVSHGLCGRRLARFGVRSPILAAASVPGSPDDAGPGAGPRHAPAGAVALATADGRLRVHRRGGGLVDAAELPGARPGRALAFGRFGHEDLALIVAVQGGALLVRLLPRNNALHARGGAGSARESGAEGALASPGAIAAGHGGPDGPDPDEDPRAALRFLAESAAPPPLDVPRTTRLAVELAARERARAPAMHRAFQRGVARLRLRAARGLARALRDGRGASGAAVATGVAGAGPGVARVEADVAVVGLGPRFVLQLRVACPGPAPVADLHVVVDADGESALVAPRLSSVPRLPAGGSAGIEVAVLVRHPAAPPPEVRVVVVRGGGGGGAGAGAGGDGRARWTPLLVLVARLPPCEDLGDE